MAFVYGDVRDVLNFINREIRYGQVNQVAGLQEEISSIARFSRSQSTEEKIFSGRLEQDKMRL